MGKRVLVTGATVMQGRPIVDALMRRGIAVRALILQDARGCRSDGLRGRRGLRSQT